MKSIFITLTAVISIHMAISSSAFAVAIDYPNLSLPQGLNFNNDSQTAFGHIISFKIGDIDFPADLVVKNPLTNQNYNIVGAMSAYSWTTNSKDAMDLTFNVSEVNRQRLKAFLLKPTSNLNVVFNYQIFSFDPKSKAFYIALKSFNIPFKGVLRKIGNNLSSMKSTSYPLQGVLRKVDDKLQITVDSSPTDAAVKSSASYSVHVSVSPGAQQQDVIQATSSTESGKLLWGN